MLQLLRRLRHAKRKGIQKDASQSVKAYLNEIRQSGTENGKHYTDTPDEVKRLKREGHNEEAIALLLESVQMTEKESEYAGEGWGVAPWYYEQLAILYRKQKRFKDEVAILERYERQPKARGAKPAKLAERLKKARLLVEKTE